MIVNVFSKKEFTTFMHLREINDKTVLDSNEYFLCIDSTGGPHSIPFFNKTHPNVLQMHFDDVFDDRTNWGEDIQDYYTAKAPTQSDILEMYYFIKGVPSEATINIYCTKGQSRSKAVGDFLKGTVEYKNDGSAYDRIVSILGEIDDR